VQASALDANALELFARVVQAGSFAAAARTVRRTLACASNCCSPTGASICCAKASTSGSG